MTTPQDAHPSDVKSATPKRSWLSRLRATGGDRVPKPAPRLHPTRFLGVLQGPEGFPHLASLTYAVDGPIALWTRSQDESLQPGFAGVLTAYKAESLTPTSLLEIPRMPVALPFLAPMPGDAWLLSGVGADGADLSCVIGASGETRAQGSLGDTPEAVCADSDGYVWVAGARSGSQLTQWTADLQPCWELPTGTSGDAGVAALNVMPGEVYAVLYEEPTIIRVRGGVATAMPTGRVKGALGVIVRGDTVGLLDAGSQQDEMVIGQVRSGRFEETHRVVLQHPRGGPLPVCFMICVGETAHLFNDAEWYAVSLTELLQDSALPSPQD